MGRTESSIFRVVSVVILLIYVIIGVLCLIVGMYGWALYALIFALLSALMVLFAFKFVS